MRKLPENLINRQNEIRQETLNKIQNAIDEIKAEGGLVTTKKLIERTGLSRSTFSKNHVKELLRMNRVCQFRDRQVIIEDKCALKLLKISKMNWIKRIKKLPS